MIRRSFRLGLTLGILGGLAFALAKMLGSRRDPETAPAPAPADPWPRLVPDPAVSAAPKTWRDEPVWPPESEWAPEPATPRPVEIYEAAPAVDDAVVDDAVADEPAPDRPVGAAWIEPEGEVCPTSHPVKAKLSSKIFHLPGMLNYDRTRPDRCYRDPEAAEDDGLRASKI